MGEVEGVSSEGQPVLKVTALRGLCGEIRLPGDPNISLMALATAASARGTSQIRRFSRRPEVKALEDIFRGLGTKIEPTDDGVTVTADGLQAPDETVNAGNSPVAFACLLGILAGKPQRSEVSAEDSCGEKVGPILEGLRALGAGVHGPAQGTFPLRLGGRGRAGGRHRIGEPEPTVKCAMLLAGLDAEGDTELYQDTGGDDDIEVLLKAAGVRVDKGRAEGEEGHRIALSGPAEAAAASHDLPVDPDAVLPVLLAAAALGRSELTIAGVGNDWKTRRLLDLIRRMNVQMQVQVGRSASGFMVRQIQVRGSELRAIKISGQHADLFLDALPIFAAIGARTPGETLIRDSEALRHGGTDRVALTVEGLRAMEARVGEVPDGLVVQGGRPLQGAEVDACGDPWLTVAFVLAGQGAEGETSIHNPGPLDAVAPGLLEALEGVSETG
jgi:3-phosphoshikimate 1-carboxyvinyltransferase